MAHIPHDATDFWKGVYFVSFSSYTSDNSVFNHSDTRVSENPVYSCIQNYKFCMFLLFSHLNNTFWHPTCGLHLSIHQGPELESADMVIIDTTHFQYPSNMCLNLSFAVFCNV